jgi:ABC-type antimicrobial peptide transport system permease subunit
VVGVVKNFIVGYPYSPVEPLVIQGPKNWFGTLSFRLNPAHSTSANLEKINAIIQKYNPDYPSNVVFVDDDYQLKFSSPQSMAQLAFLFAGMAILISCLGLYALAMYTANTRVREIGIRKVLGASATNIALLLSKNFVGLVLVAFVIASPIAWWIMNSWLQGFTYRVSVNWWIFGLTALISATIALVTISYQAIRAALANPTKNLRSE